MAIGVSRRAIPQSKYQVYSVKALGTYGLGYFSHRSAHLYRRTCRLVQAVSLMGSHAACLFPRAAIRS